MTTEENAKFDLWERKLLDLSLRNNSLNMKLSSKVIPLFVPSADELENKLNEDQDFQLKPRNAKKLRDAEKQKAEETAEGTETAEKPETADASETPETPETEEAGIEAKDYSFDDLTDISKFENVIREGFDKKILYSSYTAAELEKAVLDLYRSSRVSVEENGANTLFLSIGALKWKEQGKNNYCYAPLIFMPVDLVRKSLILGYKIRKRDEETVINVTLCEKLRQDFGIVFPEIKNLPTDDFGVDVNKIFELFETEIEGQEGWEIIKCCTLGIFSFTSFVMWNDLRARREEIAKNKIVKSLVSGKVEFDCEPMNIGDHVSEDDVYLPITADASQLYAVKAASQDRSFVLHGPPGSGKSQTITSMIANGIANGKKILFVAEKKAALDVVYKRLEKIGLAPFCLELHSNKAKKSYVLEQLKVACELTKSKNNGDYAKALADIKARREELDVYVKELHERHKSGYTLYELINVYTENEKAADIAKPGPQFWEQETEALNSKVEALMGEMGAAGAALGDVTALRCVNTTSYSQSARSEVPQKAAEFAASLERLQTVYSAYKGDSGDLKISDCAVDAGNAYKLAQWTELPQGWSAKTKEYFEQLSVYLEKNNAASVVRAKILTNWGEAFLNLDGELLRSKLAAAEGKFLKSMAVNGVYKEVKHLDKGNGRNNLGQSFADLCEYRKLAAEAESVKTNSLGGDVPAGATAELANKAIGLCDMPLEQRSVIKTKDEYDALINAYEDYVSKRSALSSLIGLAPADSFSSEALIAPDINANFDKFREKTALNVITSELDAMGLSGVTESYLSGMDIDQLIRSFRKSYSRELITEIMDSSSYLNSFSGAVMDEKIAAYKKLNDDFFALTKQEIYLKVESTLPDVAAEARASSALGILQHAIKCGGRGVSLRTLFSQIPDMITKLCPCILMSPISVAQYIDPESSVHFDTVIFDEASQLPTCNAVGVIARGENAVIVGDPNQMPPTSFFQAKQDDEETYELDDLESILDDCLALSMPQTHLLWHYRSRHESLITFSNKCFYDNKLYTFPSVNDRDTKVTYVSIDGSFDRGKTRTNRAEAEAVSDEIIRRFKDPVLSGMSLGVVTFNISQQNLIEDLLNEKVKGDSDLENKIFGSEEPVFIKNLENVQGDERDVILFSVGYGKDEEGKVYMNFGPLSSDGGWRRLNVAVTRSRCEMMVFSSLEPESIKVTAETPRGVKAFRQFLEYAQGRSNWDSDLMYAAGGEKSPVIDRDDSFKGLSAAICERLSQAGIETETDIGRSRYKVDIGIIDKENPGHYALGLLLDGPLYRSAQTTSGREIYQASVLEGLGWNIMRVWSLDWWENPDKVINKIVDRLNSKTVPVEAEVPVAPAEPVSEDESSEVSSENEGEGG